VVRDEPRECLPENAAGNGGTIEIACPWPGALCKSYAVTAGSCDVVNDLDDDPSMRASRLAFAIS
jgi:hypothetical protein